MESKQGRNLSDSNPTVLCLPELKIDLSYRVYQALIALIPMAQGVRGACVGPDCAISGGWENFANNIGTDLAPLLTVFGEQVTKQFMGESLSTMDCVLFARAPLGIITAIVGAIRVAGTPKMRALVGRAKESRGEVEADLMSSTSSDVCELWSGEGVVRVLGRPVLLQLIHLNLAIVNETRGDNNKLPEDFPILYTFHDAIKLGLYQPKDYKEGDPAVEILRDRSNPPNLSLNLSIKPTERWISILFVLIGSILQISVIVFAAVTQYQLKLIKNDAPPLGYGFPLLLCGTIALAVGMFLCAQVVETSTEEHDWLPEPSIANGTAVIWIQPGDQTVGDQRFVRRTEHNEIITSRKSKTPQHSLVFISVAASFFGFIAQFVALRAMHATVTVAQLCAVLIMTAIRSGAHISRENTNDIELPDEVEGHELDWLAKSVHHCKSWGVVSGPQVHVDLVTGDGAAPSAPSTTVPVAAAMDVMKTRARLGYLSNDWVLPTRITFDKLKNALDRTLNEVYTTMILEDGWEIQGEFPWKLPVNVRLHEGPTDTKSVHLKMTRVKDENSQWTPWKIDACELESLFCLWVSSLSNENRERDAETSTPVKNYSYVGPASDDGINDYRIWIHRMITPLHIKLSHGASYFGYVEGLPDARGDPQGVGAVSSTNQKYICIPTNVGLDTLCAHQIYTDFLASVAKIITSIGGSTGRRLSEPTTGGIDQNVPSWMHLRLVNSAIASLAAIYFESGIGTFEEAHFSIVPVLRQAGILPSLHEAARAARRAATLFEREGNWVKALEIDVWLCQNSQHSGFTRLDISAMFLDGDRRLERPASHLNMAGEEELDVLNNLLPRVWHLLCMRAEVPGRHSPALAACLLWLCTLIKRCPPNEVYKDIFGLVTGYLKQFDFSL